MQQASDTKDGGSKIMESFSSLDEGDQQVKGGSNVWPVCNHH